MTPRRARHSTGSPASANAHRRGVVLTEFMMVLLLAAFVFAATAWGLNAQLSIQRALMQQADRHAVMRAILTQLRRDLTEASAVVAIREPIHVPTTMPRIWNVPPVLRPFVGSVPRAPLDLEADYVKALVRLERPDGVVHYRLYHRGPRYWQPVNSTRPPPPPEQILVRTDAAGEERRWSLHGATLTLTPVGSDAVETPVSQARLLRVWFDLRTQYATGHDKRHKFDTTLLAGGVP